ncbi:MAG TPA: MerR family transcriptional regulator [Lactovum miscens]|uniref:MerR family transcriptional regulator n=1 Tax=Lactovum miscens TaxID=190387 RepID=UPI002ED9F1E5
MNIKEAAEKSGVSADTIRYYEKIGLITAIDRTPGGIRKIGERTLGRISFVRSMRNAGMSIEALKTYIALVDDSAEHREAQVGLLKEQRAIMVEKRDDIQHGIDHLTYKIEHYDDHMAPVEKKLQDLERQDKENIEIL